MRGEKSRNFLRALPAEAKGRRHLVGMDERSHSSCRFRPWFFLMVEFSSSNGHSHSIYPSRSVIRSFEWIVDPSTRRRRPCNRPTRQPEFFFFQKYLFLFLFLPFLLVPQLDQVPISLFLIFLNVYLIAWCLNPIARPPSSVESQSTNPLQPLFSQHTQTYFAGV